MSEPRKSTKEEPRPPSWTSLPGILLCFVVPLLLLGQWFWIRDNAIADPASWTWAGVILGSAVLLLQIKFSLGDLDSAGKGSELVLVLAFLLFLARMIVTLGGIALLPSTLNQALDGSDAQTSLVQLRGTRSPRKGSGTIARLDPAPFGKDSSAQVEVSVANKDSHKLRDGTRFRVLWHPGALGWPWGVVEEIIPPR